MEILNRISEGNSNILKIRKQLFDVITVPIEAPSEAFVRRFTSGHNANAPEGQRHLDLSKTLEPLVSPIAYINYKSTGGTPLGVVGKDFNPTQSADLLDTLEPCLIDAGADLSKLEYHTFKEDKKICFRAPIKKFGFKSKLTKLDDTIAYLNVQTGYDGYTKTSLYISTVRLICTNGMKARKTEFSASFKNTFGNNKKVEVLCNDVTKAIDKLDTFGELMEHLNTVEVSKDQVDEFYLKMLGYNRKDLKEQHTSRQKVFADIQQSVAFEMSRTGDTFWGLLNGITHYTNHVAGARTPRQDYVYMGGGEKLNDTAQKVAIELAR
jgi:hypothetical protein